MRVRRDASRRLAQALALMMAVGLSWNTVPHPPDASLLAVSPVNHDLLYAAGNGVAPGRWYVSIFKPGIPYHRIRHSMLVRTDDGGETWTIVYEGHGGEPDRSTGKPVDMVGKLAYDPLRADDVFAVFNHFEPHAEAFKEHRYTGSVVRRSRDGGSTWADLPSPVGREIVELAVGVDGRYLFAVTANGLYRLALS